MDAAAEPVTIASVVEGHGEVQALPVLLRRLAESIAPEHQVRVPKPHRIPKSSLLKGDKLGAAVSAAGHRVPGRGGILVLIDADEACPAELGPELLASAQQTRSDEQVSVVVAKCEFEAWFLAAATSLAGKRGLSEALRSPRDPESIRDAKGWITMNMAGSRSYKETADQAALAAAFDLGMARENSPSFDKLWREVEGLLSAGRKEGSR